MVHTTSLFSMTQPAGGEIGVSPAGSGSRTTTS